MRSLNMVLMGLVFVLSLPHAGAADSMKIGVVDMQKAILDVEAGKKAKRNLEEQFNKKRVEFAKEEESIKSAVEEIQKQAAILNEKVLAKKQQEIQSRMMEFQQKQGQAQAELQKKEQELMAPVIEKLKRTVEKVAKDKKFDFVMNKHEATVLFMADSSADITADVIKEFNKQK